MASHGVTRTARTRTDKQRQQDLDKIATYRQLEDEFRAALPSIKFDSSTDTNTSQLFQLTTRLLRLNPEYYTVWNLRRRCLISGSLSRPSAGSWPSRASPSSSPTTTTKPPSVGSSSSSAAATQHDPASRTTGQNGTTADDDAAVLQTELAFTFPLLVEYPKCYWIWKFRGWILEEAIVRLPVPVARKIWETELGLTSKMLSRDRRNFHAWSYRREIVARLESTSLAGVSMAEQELDYTTRMIRVDLSNYSAWHGRSSLLLRVLDERKADDAARTKALEEELALLQDALNVGPEDQSLWFYHQHIVSQISDIDSKQSQRSIAPHLSREERQGYIQQEIDFIKDLAEDYEDVKWIYQALIGYTTALVNLGIDIADQAGDRAGWLQKLKDADPLRSGRWRDLEISL
ncbi:hypothetical protein Micbo1qcDRAFT_208493 [Microdochium bolleyi]|uniref:Geranylgeranyl transferase type-2 subunit alpha n=1 Tax=Microdochium bolleyi TaxID=196109 RepID=A0A136IQA5_9PEZI|nr:hypothetical protein Micbo1qcDRAFT_208493 [Microdochium bolleyi]